MKRRIVSWFFYPSSSLFFIILMCLFAVILICVKNLHIVKISLNPQCLICQKYGEKTLLCSKQIGSCEKYSNVNNGENDFIFYQIQE